MSNPPGQSDGVLAASTAQAKKPQLLHSFDLPHLTWKSSNNVVGGGDVDGAPYPPPHNHRKRRSSVGSPSRILNSSPPHVRRPSLRDGSSSSPATIKGDAIAYGGNHPMSGIYSEVGKSTGITEKLGNSKADFTKEYRVCRQSGNNLAIESKSGVIRSTIEPEADATETKKSKILIRFPCKKADEDDRAQADPKINHKEDDDSGNKGNRNIPEEETKTWHLRPRNPTHKSPNPQNTVPPMNTRNNNNGRGAQSASGIPVENEGKRAEKRDNKRKLSINLVLTKEEIEEDIFAMTGSKPLRRPKKRARNLQKQLECVFPGLWLVGINTDSYKVSEGSMKVLHC